MDFQGVVPGTDKPAVGVDNLWIFFGVVGVCPRSHVSVMYMVQQVQEHEGRGLCMEVLLGVEVQITSSLSTVV